MNQRTSKANGLRQRRDERAPTRLSHAVPAPLRLSPLSDLGGHCAARVHGGGRATMHTTNARKQSLKRKTCHFPSRLIQSSNPSSSSFRPWSLFLVSYPSTRTVYFLPSKHLNSSAETLIEKYTHSHTTLPSTLFSLFSAQLGKK